MRNRGQEKGTPPRHDKGKWQSGGGQQGRRCTALSHTTPRGLEVGYWAGGATNAFLLEEKLAQPEEGPGSHCG